MKPETTGHCPQTGWSCNPSPGSQDQAPARQGWVRTPARRANMPPNNTISHRQQVLTASCHVTLLTFHVMVFVKCSPFSISPALLSLLPHSSVLFQGSRGACGWARKRDATERSIRAQEWLNGFKPVIRHHLFHMLSMKPSRAVISLLFMF